MLRIAILILCAIALAVAPPFGLAAVLVVALLFVFARMQAVLNEKRGR